MSNPEIGTVFKPGASVRHPFTAAASDVPEIADYVGKIRVYATKKCYISIIGAATAEDMPLAADAAEYLRIADGEVISVIRDAEDGFLTITYMAD